MKCKYYAIIEIYKPERKMVKMKSLDQRTGNYTIEQQEQLEKVEAFENGLQNIDTSNYGSLKTDQFAIFDNFIANSVRDIKEADRDLVENYVILKSYINELNTYIEKNGAAESLKQLNMMATLTTKATDILVKLGLTPKERANIAAETSELMYTYRTDELTYTFDQLKYPHLMLLIKNGRKRDIENYILKIESGEV